MRKGDPHTAKQSQGVSYHLHGKPIAQPIVVAEPAHRSSMVVPSCGECGCEQGKQGSTADDQTRTVGTAPNQTWRGDYVAVNRKAREAALRESHFAAWRLRLKVRDWV